MATFPLNAPASGLGVGTEFTESNHPNMVFTIVRAPDAHNMFEAYCGHSDLHVSRVVGDPSFVVRPVLRTSFPTHFTAWLEENSRHKHALTTSGTRETTLGVIAAYNASLAVA